MAVVFVFAISQTEQILLAEENKQNYNSLLNQSSVIRTLVYHQVTPTVYFNINASPPILSDDGNKILFAYYTYDPTRITHVMVINHDGTQATEVMNYPDSYYDLQMDISANGGTVVSTDGRQIFVSSGGGSQKILEFEIPRIEGMCICGDGTKIFFRVFESVRLVNSQGPILSKGIWAIDVNGSNLRQIVGAGNVANDLGVPVDQVPWFRSICPRYGIDVSYDGSQIVFAMFDQVVSGGAGQRIFSVSGNGSNLVSLTDRRDFVGGFISGDGSKVAYLSNKNNSAEIGIINSNGTGRKILASKPEGSLSPFPTGFPDFGNRLVLSNDGSKLLLCSTGVLCETTTGEMLQLSTGASTPWPIAGDGLWLSSMNKAGNRFCYVSGQPNDVKHLAILDLNPLTNGDAPTINNPKIDPEYVLTNGRSTTTLSTAVSTNSTLVNVGGTFLLNGLNDNQVCVSDRYPPQLLDNGTQGDALAGDGIYTNNFINALAGATVGPRTVRIKAEVVGTDGKKHATAIDFTPFQVSDGNPINNNEDIHTLVYHQVTPTVYFNINASPPILSDDGNKILFAYYTYDPTRITHVMVINHDGTQATEVMNYPDSYYDLQMDISANGGTVVSTDGRQIFVSSGGGSQKILEFEIPRIEGMCICGDGTKIFFRVFESVRLVNSQGPILSKGIWAIDVNGSNLRQIVGAGNVANDLGVPVDQVPWFRSICPRYGIDVSYDGSQIVFAMFDQVVSGGAGQRIFSVSGNGSNLVSLTDRRDFVGGFISGDGSKVAYLSNKNNSAEIGIINSNGTGRKILASKPEGSLSPFPTGFPDFGNRLVLSNDGSKLLLCSTGVLCETTTGEMLQLSTGASTPWPIAGDGLWLSSMNKAGNRFCYVSGQPNDVKHLAILDLNPLTNGDAPTINNPKIDPEYVLTNGRSTTTLSTAVSTNSTLVNVGGTFLLNGLNDNQVCVSDRYPPQLLDNGTQGDALAGDGIYTNNFINALAGATVGPRTVRIKAEVVGTDGKKHATAIDFTPFQVSENPLDVDTNHELPLAFNLYQNYPNPFNPNTKIQFALPSSAHTLLIIYDILGREIETFVNRSLNAGYHEFEFNASNLTSGIYFYRIQTGAFTQTKKMILLK